ncbi:hypothetical protein Nepgr_003595 [Nepenthes gracilis]|uniref:Transmembrane protein n=1 Tax=Nepenthes gracilis TaxID=150966 RepID=A0AAD3XE54_NEPGR|nr:hypothetical protein Nepgr_003595 [Nepenthes gracilis]
MESSEDINGWEEIQSPNRQSAVQNSGLVIRDNFYDGDFSVFPPGEHEGIQTVSEENPSSANSDSPQPPPPSEDPTVAQRKQRLGLGLQVVGEIGRQMRLRICKLSGTISGPASILRSLMAFRTKFWRLKSAAALVAALVLCMVCSKMMRRRKQVRERNRDDLRLLITEKDQKINQLLVRIAQMNELLSARRRVPVVRIG